MKIIRIIAAGSLWLISLGAVARQSPLETACRVADKVLNDVRWYYNLKLADDKDYGNTITVDFSRNFPRTGCAYALSTIVSPADTTAVMPILNYGACRIILNGQQVYGNGGMSAEEFHFIERDILLDGEIRLPLKAGVNTILVKSEAPADGEWKVHIKPGRLKFTLSGVKEIEESILKVSDWLMIGPFTAGTLDRQEVVEGEFVAGKMYASGDGSSVTWIIPRLEIVAANAQIHQPWGEGFTAFNYHAGGLAMSMEILGNYTGLPQYSGYARTFCDFYIEKWPYMAYQKYDLNAFYAWDNKVVDGYLLDYTSAPLLPYMEILLNTAPGQRDPLYLARMEEMKYYLDNIQTRTEEGNFNRINPRKYTVWVDDLYMSLPFMVQCARITEDPAERDRLMDEAVKQVFAFNEYVYHPDKKLYQHAQFTTGPVTMPFWSRGNGWALWAVTNILEHLPKNHPQYKRLMAHYRNHVEGIVALQDESGLWHNVLDRPDSYLETSGTAIFSLCIARGIRLGWLPAKKYTPVVMKGWAGIETMIGEEYEVHGITVGTNGTTDVNYYLERPTVINDDHGLFPVIVAAVEIDKLMKAQK